MADIELVVTIPEEMYKWVNDVNKFFDDYGTSDFIDLVKNGIPLPKGHGDLVDRDAINERFDSIYDAVMNCSNQSSDKYLLDKLSMCLDTALPIIEADKE